MKLNNLVALYRNMTEQNWIGLNSHTDTIIYILMYFFFIDGKPFELLFGALGANLCFRLKVEKGFVINPNLGSETYKELCKALGLKYDPANPFRTSKFLKILMGKSLHRLLLRIRQNILILLCMSGMLKKQTEYISVDGKQQ